jgi:tetratricopeptide (TPR) repeat protein
MPHLRPLQEYRHAAWPTDGPFFILAALFAAAAIARRRWRQVLPALALGVLGALRVRFVAEFALLAGPLVAAAAPRLPLLRPALVDGAVAAALALLVVVPRARATRWLDLGMEADLVPLAAVRFAEQSGLRERMYNDLEVGSYLTWDGWPRWRVFQDPRINGYPQELHAVLRRGDLSRAEWEALLGPFGVTAALITYPDVNPRAALFDPEGWALLYRGRDGLVFARRRAEWAGLIAARELPLTFVRSGDPDGGVAAQPLAAPPAASPVARCAWKKRLGDVLVERRADEQARDAYREALAGGCLAGPERAAAALALGDAAMRLGDPATAADAYRGLDDPNARTRRGLALLALHRPAEALEDLAAARRARPDDADALLGAGLALSALGRAPEAAAALRRFLSVAPAHAGAARARAELARLDGTPPPRR